MYVRIRPKQRAFFLSEQWVCCCSWEMSELHRTSQKEGKWEESKVCILEAQGFFMENSKHVPKTHNRTPNIHYPASTITNHGWLCLQANPRAVISSLKISLGTIEFFKLSHFPEVLRSRMTQGHRVQPWWGRGGARVFSPGARCALLQAPPPTPISLVLTTPLRCF